MKWYAHRNLCRRAYEFLIVDERAGRASYGTPVTFAMEAEESPGMIREPTMAMDDEAAQSLLQALWDAGLRPNDGAGSGAEVSALKAHIRFAEGVTGALLGRSPPTVTPESR